MDPAFRDKQERSIASGLRGIFARQRKRLTASQRWDEFRKEFAELMERKIKETHEGAAMLAFLLMIQGSPVAPKYDGKVLQWKSEPYAKRRAKWLAKEIEQRTKDAIDKLKKERENQAKETGKPIAPLKPSDLVPVIGPDNAESIAITETTTANTEGETEAIKKAEKAGATITVLWKTEKDDRVCPICRPLDGQPESVWGNRFDKGPPAHPRCRCEIQILTRWPDGKTDVRPMNS